MSYVLLGLGADPAAAAASAAAAAGNVFRQLPSCPAGQINDPVTGSCRADCPPGSIPVPGGCADGQGSLAGGRCINPYDINLGDTLGCFDMRWVALGGLALGVGVFLLLTAAPLAAGGALAYYGRPAEFRGWGKGEDPTEGMDLGDSWGTAKDVVARRFGYAKAPASARGPVTEVHQGPYSPTRGPVTEPASRPPPYYGPASKTRVSQSYDDGIPSHERVMASSRRRYPQSATTKRSRVYGDL